MTGAHPHRLPAARWRRIAGLAAYNCLLAGLSPLLLLWLLWRRVVQRRGIGSWRHRLGLVPRLAGGGGPRIWVHAVSAGEVVAARPVLEALHTSLPGARVALSVITNTGMAVARQSCWAAESIFYLPFDWPDPVALALWRVRPDLLVVVEKELWPNLLALARAFGARVLLVNGRVSDRMMQRAARAPGVARWLWELPHLVCVQSGRDARRLRALGIPAEAVLVAGNTKVDTLAQRDMTVERRLVEELGVSEGEQWLVAGSTHPGEEAAVVAAYRAARAREPRARLLIAPRHLERVPAVSAMLAEAGLRVARRSDGAAPGDAVVVLDTMGELRAAYGFAAAGFVGGTLAPIGGHNLLEPAAAGRAALFGPHTENCADLADLVLEARVGFRVGDAKELAEQFLRLAGDPGLRARIGAACADLITRQRGASERCAAAARALLRGRRR